MSRPIQPSGTSVPSSSRRSASASKRSPSTRSSGSSSRQSRRPRPCSSARARQLDALLLDQRVAGRLALRAEEAEAHRAADQQRVGRVEEAVDQRDLVGHLGAAEHHHERPLGRLDDRAQRGHLALEQQAGHRRAQVLGHAGGGGVRAVGGAEGVVHVGVAPARPAPRASAGSFSVSPRSQRVFSSTSTPPGSSRSTPRRTSGPTTSGAWCTGASISSPSRSRHRRERGLGVAPLRAARGASRAPAARPARAAARSWAAPRGCGRRRRPAVLERHVEVHAHEHARARARPRGRGRSACRSPSSAPQATGAPARTRCGQVHHAVRVAPLVVVPGDDLHELLVDHHRQRRRRRSTSTASVTMSRRDDRVLGVLEDALERARCRPCAAKASLISSLLVVARRPRRRGRPPSR